jgi:periplasmic divalent cation tolerance protein
MKMRLTGHAAGAGCYQKGELMSLSPSPSIAIITTTVASAADARRLAAQAVQARLAACVQVETIASHYVWQGAQHEDAEWRLTCKTLPQAAPALRAWLRAHHPYETPQLLTHAAQAEADYAQWVARQVEPRP